MSVMIKKWGNSAAVRIPAAVLETANIGIEQQVDIHAEDGKIIIEANDSYQLDDLLKGITARNQHQAIDFGESVGKEML